MPTDLPPPPWTHGEDEAPASRKEPRRRPLRGILVLALGITLVSFLGAYAVSLAERPVELVEAPAPVPGVITQAQLDSKMERAVFYLGRGQVQGASQIIIDMLNGSTCQAVDNAWGPFDTKKEAVRADAMWRSGVRNIVGPAPLLSGAVARAENPELAGGKWVAASVAIVCQAEAPPA